MERKRLERREEYRVLYKLKDFIIYYGINCTKRLTILPSRKWKIKLITL